MTVTVNGIEELKGLVGQTIGPSDWREVTQDLINQFADISRDHQWIHVDVERAKTESPFGTTVAHGNLTLSMIDGFRRRWMESTGFTIGRQLWLEQDPVPRAGSELAAASAPAPRCCPSTKSVGAGTSSSRGGPSRWRAPRSPPAWPSRSAGCSRE